MRRSSEVRAAEVPVLTSDQLPRCDLWRDGGVRFACQLRDDELQATARAGLLRLREFNGNIVTFRISLPSWTNRLEPVNYSVNQDRGSQVAEFDMTEIPEQADAQMRSSR